MTATATQNRIRKIVAVILFAFAAICAAGSVYLGYAALLLRLDGAETAARVLALRELSGHRAMNNVESPPTYLVSYAYRVLGQKYEDRRSVSKELFDDLKRTGRPVIVLYLRSDPQVNQIDRDNLTVGTLFLASSAVLSGLGGFIWLRWLARFQPPAIRFGRTPKPRS